MKECVLPSEQTNTLQGHWASLPIKLSFRSGEWSAPEISEIQAAAEAWNSFFQASKGIAVFDAGPASVGYPSTASQTLPDCSGSLNPDGVVIYKRYQSWTKATGSVAVTTSCYLTNPSAGPLATATNAILEFNYVNFFARNQFPDLRSIAVHELGHVLGLDHSCGPLGNPNQAKSYTACPDYGLYPDNFMVSAVMFRIYQFYSGGEGQTKRSLTDNDQGRANCLY